MITSLGTQWTTADLTGNGQFMDLGGGVIYVISNSLVNNTFKVYKSTNNGATFSVVASHTFTTATIEFDPAVTQWGTDLHIVGSQTNQTDDSLVDLLTFTLDTTTDTLTGPTTILTGTRIHAGYDLVVLDNQTHVIVTSVTDLVNPAIPGYSLVEVLVDINDTVTAVNVIGTTTSVRSGNVNGAITLASDGTTVELYYTSHPKKATFGSTPQQLLTRTRDAGGVWSAPTVLQDYIGFYVDDKLTVVGLSSNNRILAHLYYQQHKDKLSTVLVLGKRISGVWSWMYYTGHTDWTYMEPTLSVDVDQHIRLAYLVGDVNLGQGGALRVSDVDLATLKYTARPGHYNQLVFKWLRGSKGYVDSLTSKWAVVGEQTVRVNNVVTGYEPVFVSEYNLPPVASLVIVDGQTVIAPPVAPILRGIPLHLDASGTYDPDLDTLAYTWTLQSAPTGVVLQDVPGWPSKKDAFVPRTVGPTEQTFYVTVSVQDKTVDGTNINPPVTAQATLTIPVNAAPTVTWTPSNTLSVPRNSIIVLQPAIADADLDPMTFAWSQVSGPVLEIVGDTVSSFLAVNTKGVNVLGDTAVFQVVVSDGVNSPVTSTVNLNIASINLTNLDQKFISRNIFTTTGGVSPIGTRNNPTAQSSWKDVQVGAVSSDFFKIRHSRVALTGHRRQTYIAPHSVTVLGQENPGETYYRKVFLPGNDRGVIVDALYTEAEQVIVLTKANRLFRYTPDDIGVMNLMDIWQAAADLVPYMRGGTVKWFTCSVVYGGHRVLAFVTTKGVLLAQIREEDFRLEAVQYLSTYEFNLYGGDDILFIRFKDVESLRKGKVLIGSAAPKTDILVKSDLEYFETVYDLDLKAVQNVWDRTNRINERVETGEMLDSVAADYTGVLQAPVLHLTEIDGSTVNLTWDMVRPDLVATYQIYASVSPGIPFTKFGVSPVDPTTPFVCPDTLDTLIYPNFTASLPLVDPAPTYSWRVINGTFYGPDDTREVVVVPSSDVDQVMLSCSITTATGRHYGVTKTVLMRPSPTMITDWKVTLVAGMPGTGGSTNGPLGTNQLAAPGAAVLGNDGRLYISENECMKRLNPSTGVLEDYFAPGAYLVDPRFLNGPVATAKMSAYGHGMIKAPNGDIYFADNSSSIRRVRNDVVETFAGPNFYITGSVFGVSVDLLDMDTGLPSTVAWPGPDINVITDGTGILARFKDPQDMAFDTQGNLWVADDTCIRKITPAGVVTTPYGVPGSSFNSAGHRDGNATNARFGRAQGITVGPDDTIYVGDFGARSIRMIKGGIVSTLVRGGSGGGLHPEVNGLGAHACLTTTPTTPVVGTGGTDFYAVTAVDANGIESAASPLVPGASSTLVTLPVMPVNGVGFYLYELNSTYSVINRSGLLPSTTGTIDTATLAWGANRNLPGTPTGPAWALAPIGVLVRGTQLIFADDHLIRAINLTTGNVSTIAGDTYRDIYSNAGQGIGTRTAFTEPFYLTPGADPNTIYTDDWWGETIYKLQYGVWPVQYNPRQSAPWDMPFGQEIHCLIKATDPQWNGDPSRAYAANLIALHQYRVTLVYEDAIDLTFEVVDPTGSFSGATSQAMTLIGPGRTGQVNTFTTTMSGRHTFYIASTLEGSFQMLLEEVI